MSERNIIATLFAHPYIMLAFAIFGIIFLLIPIVLLWQLKMLTGTVFALIILAIAYGLNSMKLIDVQKYPKLGPIIIGLSIGGFIIGYASELTGAFFVTPIMEKTTPLTPPAFFSDPTSQTFISDFSGNFEIILLVIFMLILIYGWSKTRGT